MDTPRVSKAYAPDDPAICDSFDWISAGEICAMFSLMFTLSILTNNVISLWFWILATIHIGALGYGAYCYIERFVRGLLPITYDTSGVTKKDIKRFMRGDLTLDEVKANNTQLVRKYLESFIHENHLWDDDNTDSHFTYDGVQIFIGHNKIEFNNHYSSEKDKFDGKPKLTDECPTNLKELYKQAKEKYSEIQKRRNGWID